jgi:hypothetical protein
MGTPIAIDHAVLAVATGEENAYCQALIEAHKACLRMEGFNVSSSSSSR